MRTRVRCTVQQGRSSSKAPWSGALRSIVSVLVANQGQVHCRVRVRVRVRVRCTAAQPFVLELRLELGLGLG